MAVIIHLHTYGTTAEQYEQVRGRSGGDVAAAAGMLRQMGGLTPDGWCLTYLFQGEELAECYMATTLKTALEEAGVSAEAELLPTFDLEPDDE